MISCYSHFCIYFSCYSEADLKTDNRLGNEFLATQIAIMKYKMDYSQKQIADKLDISPMTVSRLLDRARKLGIVQINVMTPIENHWNLEKQIENSYSLKKAVVFRNRYNEEPIQLIGRAAAYYIDYLIGPHDIIGISPGRTIAQIVPNLKLPMIEKNQTLTVVQTEGGFATSESFSPVSILQEFVNNTGVKGHFFNLPIYAASMEAHEALSAHIALESISDLWKRINVTLSAVGTIGDESIYRISKMLSEEEMDELISKGAIGSIYGRWFNTDGKFIDSQINRRAFGIPIKVVENIPKRILITAGIEKIPAIKGVLNTDLCDIIITEETTARKLIQNNE